MCVDWTCIAGQAALFRLLSAAQVSGAARSVEPTRKADNASTHTRRGAEDAERSSHRAREAEARLERVRAAVKTCEEEAAADEEADARGGMAGTFDNLDSAAPPEPPTPAAPRLSRRPLRLSWGLARGACHAAPAAQHRQKKPKEQKNTYYIVSKELPTKSYPKITQNAAKRPHQQNGALRAPFLPAFFVAFCANFGNSWFVTLSVKNSMIMQTLALDDGAGGALKR